MSSPSIVPATSTAPTLAWPLRLAPDGSFATVPQDSPADIGQSVTLLLSSRVGERPDEPDYGTTDPTFHQLDTAEIETAAAQWEPRVDPTVVLALAEQHAQAADITLTGS